MNWKDLLESLGIDTRVWYWRIRRWRREWDDWCAGKGFRRTAGQKRHKFCEQCGALLDRDDKECARCGARAPSYRVQTVKRTLALAVPSWCPASTILFILVAAIGILRLAPETHRLLTGIGAYSVQQVELGHLWRFVSYGFLHGGWMHLAFNALVLSQVGPVIEQQVGGRRFIVVYTVSLISAAVLFGMFSLSPLVGASGALFGLIGCGAVYAHFYGGADGEAQRNFFLQWAFYALIIGFLVSGGGLMRIANSAHIGGLLAGGVLGYFLERERFRRDRNRWLWSALAVLAWLSIALSLAAMLIIWWAVK